MLQFESEDQKKKNVPANAIRQEAFLLTHRNVSPLFYSNLQQIG